MKDIILKIKDEDGIEFITEGRLYTKGRTTLIQYDETELSGMQGCTTSLTITPTRVRMRRNNEASEDTTEMIFEKGHRMKGMYYTPYGNFGMEILTNNISGSNSPDGGLDRLSIDYSINLKGLYDARKTLDIQIFGKDQPLQNFSLKDPKKDTVAEALAKFARMMSGEGGYDVQ